MKKRAKTKADFIVVNDRCPACQKTSKNPERLGEPNVLNHNGEWNGKEYNTVETQRVRCEHCGQVFFVKRVGSRE